MNQGTDTTTMRVVTYKSFLRHMSVLALILLIFLLFYTKHNTQQTEMDYHMQLQKMIYKSQEHSHGVKKLRKHPVVTERPEVYTSISEMWSTESMATFDIADSTESVTVTTTAQEMDPLLTLDPNVIIITNRTTKMKRQIWLRDGDESFRMCTNLEPSMRCWFDNRAEAYNRSHAVFFRGQHVFRNDGPPKYRPQGQKWIFYETEPPTKTWGPHLDYNHPVWTWFNMTVTYTSDSSVPNNIYKQECRPNNAWRLSGINFAKSKNRKVAWFVSNCNTSSLREAYVARLKQFIKVDVFGACGASKCSKNEPNPMGCVQKLLNEKYKFYLSFENSLCDEYYTEKLVRTLSAHVVPIVLGSVDYSHVLPPGSYLDVHKFPSPKELAKYLLHLDKYDEAYNNFIENKFRFTCRNIGNDEPFACRLCRHLHEMRNTREVIPDIRTFWGTKERCLSPKQYYKGVADDIVVKERTPKAFVDAGVN